ncbi:uncharacterized protein LOC6525603 [Drosophila yakuba]|uniref:MD-2-related lipid-recognition domain-containing protein n=1 Tax=Drosophila yakuba TaxID=7245 RepID=B4Q1X1_DROYA|nr:uncharacterized protein LOC6525603 [Drosophila yakuba]EDX02546.1 uncharacterized protein Dyak_GE17634 [Drosophila yakuba]
MEQCIGWIIGLLCILQSLQGTQGMNYEVLGDDTTLNIKCNAAEDRGNTPMQQIIDISNLTFNMAKDLETLYFNGDIRVLMDLPNRPIVLQVDVFRWERSEWIPTPLALKRNNLCHALFDPLELWHLVFMKVPKKEKVCPPTKGHVYSLVNVSNHVFLRNLPRMDVAGDVKALVHLTSGDIKTCAALYFKIYATNH